jgi:hypothetical protein
MIVEAIGDGFKVIDATSEVDSCHRRATELSMRTATMTELDLEVQEGDITVTSPGTSYTVTYYKPKNSRQLLAKRIASKDDLSVAMTVDEFLAAARRLANHKACSAGLFSAQPPSASIWAARESATAPLIMPPRLKAYSRPCGLTQPSRRRTSGMVWLCLG